MSLNETPSAERLHIGFFGIRNAGKSSLVNAVTGQDLALVSDVRGTTTDPVRKAMELLPLGPVVIIDTPGIDDTGGLGEMRVQRAIRELYRTDVAVLVVDAACGISSDDEMLLSEFRKRNIPAIIAFNKSDLLSDEELSVLVQADTAKYGNAVNLIAVSAMTGSNIHELKELIGSVATRSSGDRQLIGDLISPEDLLILVTPIDESAPRGRIILPQQQMIRDILDSHAMNMVVQPEELPAALSVINGKPRMVITDSQVFSEVNAMVPEDIQLTSFSILMARYKGELFEFARGAAAMDRLRDGDTLLLAEGCTHHRQCNDIGTVKLPGWIRSYTGKDLRFEFTSGGDFPSDLSRYALVIHCGACMLNEREVHSRIGLALDAGVPITNYGIAIAQMNGILGRALSPFSEY